ncbi:MAG: hypothetical protein QOJ99_5765 [Bryobacterales bacterium]|jgi:hypothetical protein|nr:hypothetical protein [Bryobacterales bacterium]
MGDSPRLRIPLLEGVVPSLLRIPSFGARPFRSHERNLLIRIFGDSINLDPVRVAYTRLLFAGTTAYTMGNTILIPVGTSTDTSTLVHEMTHVWQYQTMGTRYISDSALHQIVQGSNAYDVDLVLGQSFYSYAAEQQAMIVQRYYDDFPGWRTNADVVRMLGEVRRARPLPPSEIERETWYGPHRPFTDPSPGSGGQQPSQTVPLFRIEF